MDWHFSTLFEPPSHTTPFSMPLWFNQHSYPSACIEENLGFITLSQDGEARNWTADLICSPDNLLQTFQEAKGLGHRINRTFGEGQLCCQSRRLLYSQFHKEKFRCASEMPSPLQLIVCRWILIVVQFQTCFAVWHQQLSHYRRRKWQYSLARHTATETLLQVICSSDTTCAANFSITFMSFRVE